MPMIPTTRSMMPVRGSTRKPHATVNRPAATHEKAFQTKASSGCRKTHSKAYTDSTAVPVALVTVTAVLSVYAFEWVFRHPDEAFVWNAFSWVAAGRLTAERGFLVEPLTGIMLLVVGIIGMLVHYYSIGYMHDDPGYYL